MKNRELWSVYEEDYLQRGKKEAELITRKMEVLEGVLKEEIRLREKAEKRLKFLMKKLELIKGSKSLEGSEKLSSSEVSCLSSSVSTSASKEEDEEENHNRTDKPSDNVASMEDGLGSKLKSVSDGEGKVITSTTSHEEESQCDNNYPFKNQEIDKQDKNKEAKVENKGVVEVLDE